MTLNLRNFHDEFAAEVEQKAETEEQKIAGKKVLWMIIERGFSFTHSTKSMAKKHGIKCAPLMRLIRGILPEEYFEDQQRKGLETARAIRAAKAKTK